MYLKSFKILFFMYHLINRSALQIVTCWNKTVVLDYSFYFGIKH